MDEPADLVNLARVESDRRLVEHQHRRIVNDRLREAHALAIALGKLAADAMGHVGEAANLEHALDRVVDLRAAQSAQLGDEAQVGLHAHVGVERRRLGQVADTPARFQRLGEDVQAVNQYGAGRRRHETGDDPHRSGFAGAVGAEEAQDRALVGLEGDVAHGNEVTVALGQVFYLDHADRLGGSRYTAPNPNGF